MQQQGVDELVPLGVALQHVDNLRVIRREVGDPVERHPDGHAVLGQQALADEGDERADAVERLLDAAAADDEQERAAAGRRHLRANRLAQPRPELGLRRWSLGHEPRR